MLRVSQVNIKGVIYKAELMSCKCYKCGRNMYQYKQPGLLNGNKITPVYKICRKCRKKALIRFE